MTAHWRCGPPAGAGTGAADVDLDRVWLGVAAQVWRRRPGPVERLAGRLLRSPGLARALVTTPSLLLGWVIATVVVLAAGVLATLATGTPYVALLAPAVAAAGIAYAYGPGIDPAWELSLSMAVSDRMVLLVRALAVFGAERGPRAGRLGRVGGRGGGHVRLAGPDDRGVRAGAGRGDGRPLGERRRGRGPGRLGDHGAVRQAAAGRLTRRGHRPPRWSFPTWRSPPAAPRSSLYATRIPRGTS